jgi:hypothetical protein
MKPREAISVRRIDSEAGFLVLAQMIQAHHPGGAPDQIKATHWAGAYENGRLVAAIGWVEEKPGMRMLVEVDKTPDHWGKVGVFTLIRGMIASCKQHGIRLQGLVLPSNEQLKRALTREKCRCVVEVWEVPE